MKLEYSKRAVADLEKIAVRSHAEYGARVTRALEQRILAVTERVSRAPLSARPVADRPGIRVVPLLRYPFKIFFRFEGETIRILHVRHTARQDWNAME